MNIGLIRPTPGFSPTECLQAWKRGPIGSLIHIFKVTNPWRRYPIQQSPVVPTTWYWELLQREPAVPGPLPLCPPAALGRAGAAEDAQMTPLSAVPKRGREDLRSRLHNWFPNPWTFCASPLTRKTPTRHSWQKDLMESMASWARGGRAQGMAPSPQNCGVVRTTRIDSRSHFTYRMQTR